MRLTDAVRIGARWLPLAAAFAMPGAAAADTGPETSAHERTHATVGVELGGYFPQVVSELGTSFDATLELGYLLPFAEQRLEAYGDLGYTQPTHTGTMTDPRLPDGGAYTYELTEQQLAIDLGALYRLKPPRTRMNYFGQLGLRIDLQRSKVDGAAGGAAFGQNQETATALGIHVACGVEYMLGPGAMVGELDFGASNLDQRVTGDTTAGGLSARAGYHLFF